MAPGRFHHYYGLPDRLRESEARVLAAVHNRGNCSVRDIAADVSMSIAGTWDVLRRLKQRGLVAWTIGKQSTIHPSFEAVPVRVPENV